MIHRIDIEIDREQLLEEFGNIDLLPFRGQDWFASQEDWLIKTDHQSAGETQKLIEYFESVFNTKVMISFVEQKEDTSVPFHKDYGHRTCINVILEGDAPIIFEDGGEEYYDVAILDVSKRHRVPAGKRRKLLKFHLGRIKFHAAVEKWNSSQNILA